jgi:hypothetical protein
MHNLCFIHNSGVYFTILSFLLEITTKFSYGLYQNLNAHKKKSAGPFPLWHLKGYHLKVNNAWERM